MYVGICAFISSDGLPHENRKTCIYRMSSRGNFNADIPYVPVESLIISTVHVPLDFARIGGGGEGN